ncbi:hypothetical protein NAT51_05460 [Flavobacterium amniphilum]|uniref:hypothetical protein n=1 Tax=Flavobacterium amniphilum TaxID=1834035 RepID=UPI00202A9A05|nr:hypothetical protein [Flavobacterium amniphilum]MCL9804954.1 hypothetical protein [Flavobacterium amniphilum]
MSIILSLCSLILLAVPLVYQLICGYKSIKGLTKMSITEIGFTSFMAQILVTIVSFFLFTMSMNQSEEDIKCMTPAVGIIGISFMIGIILIVVTIIQAVIKAIYNRKSKKEYRSSTN